MAYGLGHSWDLTVHEQHGSLPLMDDHVSVYVIFIIYIYMCVYNHFGVWNCLVFDCDRPRPVMIVEWLYNQMIAVRQVMMGIYWG